MSNDKDTKAEPQTVDYSLKADVIMQELPHNIKDIYKIAFHCVKWMHEHEVAPMQQELEQYKDAIKSRNILQAEDKARVAELEGLLREALPHLASAVRSFPQTPKEEEYFDRITSALSGTEEKQKP